MARNGFRFERAPAVTSGRTLGQPVKRHGFHPRPSVSLLAAAIGAIRLCVVRVNGRDNDCASDQSDHDHNPECYVLHSHNPPSPIPHVKKRIVPKRRQVGLVPCTDKIGHQSVGAPDRAGCPARRVGVDRTPGLRPTRRECSLPRRGEAGQELLSHKGRVLPHARARARQTKEAAN
jgi:hypothetical protein